MHYAMTDLLLQLILNVGIKYEMQLLRSYLPTLCRQIGLLYLVAWCIKLLTVVGKEQEIESNKKTQERCLL